MPLPLRKPPKPETEKAEDEPPPHPGEIEVPDWTERQIEQAKSACETALESLEIDYEPAPPIREGVCGTPYPIKVMSFGIDPAVSLAPPATMTCEMAAGLHNWLGAYVQKTAREKLGNPIVLLRNAASYSCRNRNNSPEARISEHALANALDISAFVTEEGTTVSVLEDWGNVVERMKEKDAPDEGGSWPLPPSVSEKIRPPQPEASPPLAAVAAKAPDVNTGQPVLTTGDVSRLAQGGAVPAMPAEQTPEMPASEEPDKPSPAQEAEAAKESPEPNPRLEFLQATHASACVTFGTVLGPEANEAHRDHFHLDAAERKYGNYCR